MTMFRAKLIMKTHKIGQTAQTTGYHLSKMDEFAQFASKMAISAHTTDQFKEMVLTRIFCTPYSLGTPHPKRPLPDGCLIERDAKNGHLTLVQEKIGTRTLGSEA
jgi:hypothetical protein